MENSKNTHFILPTNNTNAASNLTSGSSADARNGKGTGSISIVDPENGITVQNKDGAEVEMSPEAVMAHEVLGHGFDKDMGILENGVNPETGEKYREESAMQAEQEYQEAVGEQQRDCRDNC